MKKILFAIMTFFVHANCLAQSGNLAFYELQHVVDTLNFSQNSTNGSYYNANDTVIITVPQNEIWYLQKSILTLHFKDASKGFTQQYSNCQCVTIDGVVLHSVLSSKYWNFTYSSGSGAIFPVGISSGVGSSYLELGTISDFFGERIPLTSGEHILYSGITVGSASSWGSPNPIQHDFFIEKYMMTP